MELNTDILFPHLADASSLVIACGQQDYSASVIARAVEDCDAHLVNLNVLADRTPYGGVKVALRIDHRNASAVARSLQRFGYEVMEVESPEAYDPGAEQSRDRANELLRYLEV